MIRKKLLIHAKLFLSSWKMLSLENCNKTTVKILQSVLVFCDHFLGKRLRQREIMCKERLFCTKDNWSRYLYMQEKEVNVLKVGISSTSIFKLIIWNKRFWILQHWYGIVVQSSVYLIKYIVKCFCYSGFLDNHILRTLRILTHHCWNNCCN